MSVCPLGVLKIVVDTFNGHMVSSSISLIFICWLVVRNVSVSFIVAVTITSFVDSVGMLKVFGKNSTMSPTLLWPF